MRLLILPRKYTIYPKNIDYPFFITKSKDDVRPAHFYFTEKMFRFEQMKSKIVFILLAVLLGCKASAQTVAPQDIDKFQIMEDSMLLTSDSMYNAFIPDTRVMYAERFVRQLVRALKIPGSYYYHFDKIKDRVNIIYADDSAFRMFNWVIEPSAILKHYYGAIQMPGERLKLYGLRDYAEEMEKGAEDSILTDGKWFGAIYYRIMAHEVEGQKVYTLFGLNSSSMISNRKVLDALTFTGNGVVFGAPIFGIASENFPNSRVNRFILEYKKDVQVSMNWDPERQVIMFDKLVSQVNDPNRKYTYVPSGQYDALKWENEMWNYHRDVIPVTILKDGEAPQLDTK
jgi:hypothetical protein